MSSVVYETQHSIRLDRPQAGSTTTATFSLREQRRVTPATSNHTEPVIDSDFEQAEHSRYVRHSRSFSNIDHLQQGEEELARMAAPQTPANAAHRHASMHQHTPNNAHGRQMMPNSDSKYSSSSHTISAERADNERRMRAQRRKTDGSDEIKSLSRPSTSHGSSAMRKATYSQYPDFETIKDPFAKRDKIPRKHRQQLPLDNPNDFSKAGTVPALGTETEAGVSRAGGAHASVAAADHARKDSQEGVPTPLKKRDKIPRHAVNQQPLHLISPPPQAAAKPAPALAPAETLQMEPMDSPFPDSPVTPAARMPAQSMDRTLIAETLISPVSLLSPQSVNISAPAPAPAAVSVPVPARTASLQPVNTNMAATMSPVGAMSPRTNSPRMHIDMDKVETLYARQSMIFERNKQQMRDSKLFSSSSSSYSSGNNSFGSAKSPAASREAQPSAGPRGMGSIEEEHNGDVAQMGIYGHGTSKVHCKPDSSNNNNNNNNNDDDDDQHIPFDQVLIPTAFKRLRALLEDPSFEIDDETYRRFKLSERWYARQERLQVELVFNMGTFGESKRRERVIQKRLSETSQVSSVAAASFTEAQTTKLVQQKPAMPSPAASDNKSVLPTLVESDNENLEGRLETHNVAVPERRLGQIDEDHNNIAEPGIRYDTLKRCVPSVHYQQSYETDQGGYVPPKQPKPAQMQPFGVQDPDYVPLRSHSRHDNPAQQSHRRQMQKQQKQQQHLQSSSPAQKKQALCGLCIIM